MVQCRILFINVVDGRCWTLHAANLLNPLQGFEQQDSDVRARLIHMDLFVPSRVQGVWFKILSTHHAWSQPFTNRLQTGCRFQSPCVVYQEPPHCNQHTQRMHTCRVISISLQFQACFLLKGLYYCLKDGDRPLKHRFQSSAATRISGRRIWRLVRTCRFGQCNNHIWLSFDLRFPILYCNRGWPI